MTDSIAGLPFWELVFDADGDPDPTARDGALSEIPQHGLTDLLVFAHGWNNDRTTARRLYDGFYGLLAGQLAAHPPARAANVGLAGVMWPSQRWSDEPIPDFTPSGPAIDSGGGTASAAPALETSTTVDPLVDPATLEQLTALFPTGKADLTRMTELLTGPATDEARAEFRDRLIAFTTHASNADDDGESTGGAPPDRPPMLHDDATTLFGRYRDALTTSGADIGDPDVSIGTADIGDLLHKAWDGAKEALRGATYWAMKNRAGTIGRLGLGPFLDELQAARPGIRVHLIGHSFGARLVSYALAGMSDTTPSPVASLTLLEGAFSHFAFVPSLAFDPSRSGALAGLRGRVAGPVTVCFSSHDAAVGSFYPLASFAAGDDTAGAHGPMWRWGGMGADGAQNDDASCVGILPAGPASIYPFTTDTILNVDSSDVVKVGGPPSGAHSDIVHEELTWIVLAAGELT